MVEMVEEGAQAASLRASVEQTEGTVNRANRYMEPHPDTVNPTVTEGFEEPPLSSVCRAASVIRDTSKQVEAADLETSDQPTDCKATRAHDVYQYLT